jgi:hypothetical protein
MLKASKAVIFVGVGDRGCWRRNAPEHWRRHKAIRPTEPWRQQRHIPQPDKDELRRRVEEFCRATRPQVEALKAAFPPRSREGEIHRLLIERLV